MRTPLRIAAALTCLGLIAASASAGWRSKGYRAVPVVQATATGSGYLLVPRRHHFWHHRFKGGQVILLSPQTAGYYQPGAYAAPYTAPYVAPYTAPYAAPYAGCAGGYTAPYAAPYAGCAGGYTAPLTGCSGGPSGLRTGPRTGRDVAASTDADTEIDRRIARWKNGVSVDVTVRVRIHGAGGDVRPEDGGGERPSGSLGADLKKAFAADKAADRGNAQDIKTLAELYRGAAEKVSEPEVDTIEILRRELIAAGKQRDITGKKLFETRTVAQEYFRGKLGNIDREAPLDRVAKKRVAQVLAEIAAALEQIQ